MGRNLSTLEFDNKIKFMRQQPKDAWAITQQQQNECLRIPSHMPKG